MSNEIKAYKAFDEDWTCRGFQYEVGKTYEHNGTVKACDSGFHACENPFDVWSYYAPTNVKYATVTLSGETSRNNDDSKVAAAKITIEAELSAGQFIKNCVDWIVQATKGKTESGYGAKIGSSGDCDQIGSSGNGSQIGSSGNGSQIGSSGNGSQIGSSGDCAKIGSSGDWARIGSSGDWARIGSSGYGSQIGSSGYGSQIGSSGDCDQIGSSGNGSRIEATGKKSVISSSGKKTTARGATGTWISLAEFNDTGECVGFATGCIGQDGLKESTWYRARGGKLEPVT